jgi:hypothetical protein
MAGRRRIFAVLTVVVLVPSMALAAGCQLVGSGTLNYVPVAYPAGTSGPDEPAATSGSIATIHAFRRDPGDAWPPQGKVALWVRAENIPPLRTAPDESVYLMRLFAPQEAAPAYGGVRTCGELAANTGRLPFYPALVIGHLRIGDDRTLNQVVLADDTPEVRQSSWAIVNNDAFYSGQAIRCGEMIFAR